MKTRNLVLVVLAIFSVKVCVLLYAEEAPSAEKEPPSKENVQPLPMGTPPPTSEPPFIIPGSPVPSAQEDIEWEEKLRMEREQRDLRIHDTERAVWEGQQEVERIRVEQEEMEYQ